MNFLDLFSGIGGFRLGAQWAGLKFENEFHSDIDDYANKVYAKHFPDSISLGDITKIKVEDLLKYGNEWIITGGFPCQDISIAGKGAGITGERSGLWFEYWRLIRNLRPRFAIMENVGMLVHRGLREVLGSLAEIGYNAEWQDIRAEDVGAPHRRERIWIVAYAIDNSNRANRTTCREKEVIQEEHRPSRRSRMPSGANEKISNSIGQHDDNSGHGTSQIRREFPEKAKIQGSISNADNQRTLRGEWSQENVDRQIRGNGRNGNFQWWATEPELGRLAHGIPNRVDRLKCLGNSIVPQIAYILFQNLIERNLL